MFQFIPVTVGIVEPVRRRFCFVLRWAGFVDNFSPFWNSNQFVPRKAFLVRVNRRGIVVACCVVLVFVAVADLLARPFILATR